MNNVNAVPPNIPHGVFLVKKLKLTDINQSSIAAGLQQQSKRVLLLIKALFYLDGDYKQIGNAKFDQYKLHGIIVTKGLVRLDHNQFGQMHVASTQLLTIIL